MGVFLLLGLLSVGLLVGGCPGVTMPRRNQNRNQNQNPKMTASPKAPAATIP